MCHLPPIPISREAAAGSARAKVDVVGPAFCLQVAYTWRYVSRECKNACVVCSHTYSRNQNIYNECNALKNPRHRIRQTGLALSTMNLRDDVGPNFSARGHLG